MSNIHVRVEMDPGGTQYLFNVSAPQARDSFREVFPDSQFVRTGAAHSPLAGTTIHIVLAGLSAGAGIVAIEALKEAGKSLWKALSKITVHKAKGMDPEEAGDGDRFKITVKLGDLSVTTETSGMIGGQNEYLRNFLDSTLPRLYEIGDSVSRQKGVPGDKWFRLPEGHNELEYRWHDNKLHLIRSHKKFDPKGSLISMDEEM
jgi:hypothetical protein